MSTTTTREQIADLFMLDKQEQLHPELARYRVWLQSGLMIKHPLVFSFMHHDAMNAYVNHQLKMKQEAVQQALDSHEYPHLHLAARTPLSRQCPERDRQSLHPKPILEPRRAGVAGLRERLAEQAPVAHPMARQSPRSRMVHG